MGLETRIARRYLFQKDKGTLSTLLALIGFMGVVLSVFSLLMIQFVMTGFSLDVRQKILHFSPSIVLKPLRTELYSGKIPPQIPSHLNLEGPFPYLETEVILRTSEDSGQGLKIKGVELTDPMLTQKLKVDYAEGLGPPDLLSREEILPGIILGAELVKRLNIFPSLSEELDLIYPFGDIDPSGDMRPKTRRFRVIGTFKSGYYEYDNKFALIALPEARKLVPAREVPIEWGLQSPHFFEASRLAQELNRNLTPHYHAESWGEHNQKLLSALKVERFTMWMVLGLMIVISTFNIFSLLMMLVVNKQKEMAVFRAMGLPQKKIVSIFTRIGLFIGISGTLLGTLLALLFTCVLKWHPLKVPAPYYLDTLPIQFDFSTLFFVLLLAPLLAALASCYPAYRGGKFDISESLRYE